MSEEQKPPRYEIRLEYTDFKQDKHQNCHAIKFDQYNVIIQHADMSIEYINRTYVKRAVVFEVKEYRRPEYDEEIKREIGGI